MKYKNYILGVVKKSSKIYTLSNIEGILDTITLVSNKELVEETHRLCSVLRVDRNIPMTLL